MSTETILYNSLKEYAGHLIERERIVESLWNILKNQTKIPIETSEKPKDGTCWKSEFLEFSWPIRGEELVIKLRKQTRMMYDNQGSLIFAVRIPSHLHSPLLKLMIGEIKQYLSI